MAERISVPSFYISPEEAFETTQNLPKDNVVRHLLASAIKKYEATITEIDQRVMFIDKKGEGFNITFNGELVGTLKYYIYPTARFWRASFIQEVKIKQFNRADINKIKREISVALVNEAKRQKVHGAPPVTIGDADELL